MSITPVQIPAVLTPVVILARPQMGENIGATARAMKNCGLMSCLLYTSDAADEE